MGKYVDDNLMAGENIMYEAKVSWLVYVKPLAIALALCLLGMTVEPTAGKLLAIMGLLTGAGGFLLAAIQRNATEIAVTNKRLILKTGFVKRDTFEQFLEKVDSISVDQTVMERLCNVGTITVRGSGQSFTPVRNIDDPLIFRKHVNEQVDQARSRG